MFPGKKMYFCLLVLAFITVTWFVLLGYRMDHYVLIQKVAVLGLFFSVAKFLSYALLQKNGDEFVQRFPFADNKRKAIVVLIEGFFFIYFSWLVLRVFNHLTMTVPIPYADEKLIQLDQLIGLNWQEYFKFVAQSPLLVLIFDKAYTGLSNLSLIAFVGLVLTNRLKQAKFFVVAFSITAIVCTLIGMFFPAKAAVDQLLTEPQLLNNFPYSPGTYSVEIIERLRSSKSQFFDLDNLPGLTTFPSFHTAAGIVLVYSYRGSFLVIPVLIYTVIMIASTPVFGGHYFVDIIAGTVVALVICRLVERTSEFGGVFQKSYSNKHVSSWNDARVN